MNYLLLTCSILVSINSFGQWIELDNKMAETSGLEQFDNGWITFNDSGNEPILYKINQKGEILKEFPIKGIKNTDWEDITFDGKNYFLADLGNNSGNRKDLVIYILSNTLNLEDSIQITYQKQNNFKSRKIHSFDSEAIISYKDSLLIFSKDRKNLYSTIYAIPKKAGKYALEKIGRLNVNCLITGADYDEKSSLLVLTGYNFILKQFLIQIPNFNPSGENSIQKEEIDLKPGQIEAVKILNKKTFLLSSEAIRGEKAKIITWNISN